MYLNKERLEGIIKARQRNAAEHGLECAEFQNPSADKIEAYRKRNAARKGQKVKDKAKGEEKKAGATPAHAAVGGRPTMEEFMSGVEDIMGMALVGELGGGEPSQFSVPPPRTSCRRGCRGNRLGRGLNGRRSGTEHAVVRPHANRPEHS